MLTLIDAETTFQIIDKKLDPSPFHPYNKLVSLGWWTEKTGYQYRFYYHTNIKQFDDIKEFQDILDNTSILVAHNMKFDLQWLRNCGLQYDGIIHDTMIREYVMARGTKLHVSLEESCKRNNVTLKKSELIEKFLKDKISFEYIPIDIIQEYGIGDLEATLALYNNQLERLKECEYLIPTINLMEEFCKVLCNMETNGIHIDVDTLYKLEEKYQKEYNELEIILKKLAQEAWGDEPININSPEQLSQLLYSRKVKDKKKWKMIFNLGTELRGSVVKPKYPPKMSDKEFVDAVIENTSIIYKGVAFPCSCRIVDDGDNILLAKTSHKKGKCKSCGGFGVCYERSDTIAGFRFSPKGAQDSAIGGFSTSKESIQRLRETARGPAKVFLEIYTRYNAIDTYLNTFVQGIKRGLINGFIHTSYMQCITATGRLSSRNPNFQNMPRGNTFEVKRCVTSRFSGGCITEADARQLEFRIAGELSDDQQIREDIANGVDVHSATARWTGLSRQDSKSHTFAPVYGAMSQGKPKHIAAYYDYFKEHYKGLSTAHDDWAERVLATGGYFRLPSGREYYYPNTRRFYNGRISNSTIIRNYPVQGWATGDIVPLWYIEFQKLVKGYKSILILTVHDSLVVDTHPDEQKIVVDFLYKSWYNATQVEPKKRWNYEIKIPLEIEVKQGPNWLEMKDII